MGKTGVAACPTGWPATMRACNQCFCCSLRAWPAAQDVSLFGERAGERTKKLVQAVRAAEGRLASPFVAEVGGVNIHAGVAVHGRDRQALERLCRYVTRPPIALERLTRRDDGCVEYAFRKPWRDGTRAVVLTADDLLARSCAPWDKARRRDFI